MSQTVMVGTRVSPDTEQRIKQLAEQMGITPARLIGNAIAQYLGDDVAPSPVDRLSELEQTVSALNRRISGLSQLKKSPENRLQDTSKESRVSLDVSDSVKADCPKCQSDRTRREGRGKVRTNGTRSQRFLCRDCGNLFAIG
ncbi:hypothetical protein [Leptolyngbya sp. FACHB-1624]|uniref:CopG family ribbon-helix-helix protein n=1 Tax=Leptolyngbya sp. FACHB-1624 TaxID=2692802 RepID=UPI0039E95EF7